ncbi:kinase-like domain-containing protein [Syncephalis fuscata]|nr:kinase-like domain-containing protein [Syncephalis fuscata]
MLASTRIICLLLCQVIALIIGIKNVTAIPANKPDNKITYDFPKKLAQHKFITNDIIHSNEKVFVARTNYGKKPAVAKCITEPRHIEAEQLAFNTLVQKGKNVNDKTGQKYIVSLFTDFKIDDNCHCFILEDIGGKTLDAYTSNMSIERKQKQLPIIFKQILEGIAYLHRIGLAHNDIKPQNVIVRDWGLWWGIQVMIIDFDHAKLLATDPQSKKTELANVGTIIYRPPESFTNTPADPRLYDSWSAGATFYEAVSGRKPFVGFFNKGLITLAELESCMKTLRENNFKRMLYPMFEESYTEILLENLINQVNELMVFDYRKRPTPEQVLLRINSK